MYRLFPILLLLFHCVGFSQSTTKSHTSHFASGKHLLTDSEQDSLQGWLSTIPKNASFSIEGHTDNIGSIKANQDLSAKRIEVIQKLLSDWGVTEESLSTSSFGEMKPMADNFTPKGRQINRRVQVTAHFVEDTSTIWQLFRQLDPGYQTFSINNTRDTMLQAEQGTFIKIPANAFDLPTGCDRRKMTVRIKEAFDTPDIIKNNLSTTSNGRTLETRGMIYLNALCGEQRVKLRNGKKITNLMPVKDPTDNLMLFQGERNIKESTINWVRPQNSLQPLGVNLNWRCMSCPLFFCGITRFFRPSSDIVFPRCSDFIRTCHRFSITSDDALPALYEEYGVDNLEDLREAMRQEKIAQVESRLKRGRASNNDVTYYIMSQTNLGWENIDFFSNFPKRNLLTMKTGLKSRHNTALFLIFQDHRIVLPAHRSSEFYFKDIPKNEPVKLLALKHSYGSASIATADFKVKEEAPPLHFRQVSIEKLKEEINDLAPNQPSVAMIKSSAF